MISNTKKILLIALPLLLSACIAPVQPYAPNASYGVSVQTPRPYNYQQPPVYVKPQHNEQHNHDNEHHDNGKHNGQYKNNKHKD